MISAPGALPSETDVLVAGSGAAGLTAALTAASSGLSVLLVESANRWGGTTALGGGRVWLPPGSHPGDSEEASIEYLTAVFGTERSEMIEAFVGSARPMAAFVESHSRHRFIPCIDYPDYHTDLPGWVPGGRAHDSPTTDLNELVGEAADVLLPPGYVPTTHFEWEQWRFPSQFDWKLIEERWRQRILTHGASLVAARLDGAGRAGRRLVKSARLVDVDQPSETSIKVRIARGETEVAITTGALILATGGFDADTELRSNHLPSSLSASAAAPTNTGVALRLAMGHDFAVDNLDQGWWMPLVEVPGESIDDTPYPRALVRERGVPHQIVVNRAGARFVDEAAPYHEFVKAMQIEIDGQYPNQEAWLVFDERFRSKYSFPGLHRDGEVPDHVRTARSTEGLSVLLGIDPKALAATIGRWNEMCAIGQDLDFGRGDNHYDRYYGDPDAPGHPNLGAIDTPPFYGARILSGVVGSKGGPVTDRDGRILGVDRRPRDGWYAVGNASAWWTGDGYPGPGATLGIGMTYGHRAGLDAIRFLMSDPDRSV